jgi:hypothetical protein
VWNAHAAVPALCLALLAPSPQAIAEATPGEVIRADVIPADVIPADEESGAGGTILANSLMDTNPRDAFLRGYVSGVLTSVLDGTRAPTSIVLGVSDGTVYLDAATPKATRHIVEMHLREISDVRRIVWHMRERSFA